MISNWVGNCENMTIVNVIELLGWLGFFLFGMSLLGDGLKCVAGSKLETVLSRLTSNTLALSEKETRIAAKYLFWITNVVRNSDYAVNSAELAKELDEKNIHFSDSAMSELDLCAKAA